MNQRLKEIVTDALRYWERMRIVYNAVLALIVITYFVAGLPTSLRVFEFNQLLVFILLAVAANVLYCLAYLPDVFIQLSGFSEVWRKTRIGLFLIGLGVAAIFTYWISFAAFLTSY